MFDALGDRLEGVFKKLRGEGAITEKNIREAIAELVSSPERARAMGQSARQRIVSLYSWQVHCEALERVLAGVTEGADA